ncbi:MAG: rhomboid family intramembrane serine protease [Proteobacteria bacterium]|nr:rhomboid family intramembrane serine protease [Pseudomonadota bacterium]
MKQRAILCPRCRRLIGSEETTCSWCGTSRSAPWWKFLNWTRGTADGDWLLKTLITANLLYFALSLILSTRLGGISGFFSPGQTSLLLLGATGTYPIDNFGRYWTLISANYLHGGILHIAFNMMALKQIAPLVSNEYGPSRMFSIYTIGGVFGYVVSYFAGVSFTIGASAAICGLIGAMLYYGKSRGGAYGNSVYREVSGWVIGLFIFGLIFPGINNWAHGGGIIGGIIMGALLGYNERRRENNFDQALALLLGTVTLGTLGWAVMGTFMHM